MSLIKIFPAFSNETERNIQAQIAGEVYGMNIYLVDNKSGVDLYLEISFPNGNLYERGHSIYDKPYEIARELGKFKEKFIAQYPSKESVVEKQSNYYTDLWDKMCAGELVQNRHHLVSYTKFKIIFGDAITEVEFNEVLAKLKAKQLAINEIARLEKEKTDALYQENLKQAKILRINHIKEQIKLNKPISGAELVELCKIYNINIPIRTKGFFNEKISEVNKDSARGSVKKGQKITNHPSGYYKDLMEYIDLEENSAKYEKAKELFPNKS